MPVMRRRDSVSLIVPFVLLALGVAGAAVPYVPSGGWILDHVRVLSAPEMDGRASGTPGADRAAK